MTNEEIADALSRLSVRADLPALLDERRENIYTRGARRFIHAVGVVWAIGTPNERRRKYQELLEEYGPTEDSQPWGLDAEIVPLLEAMKERLENDDDDRRVYGIR